VRISIRRAQTSAANRPSKEQLKLVNLQKERQNVLSIDITTAIRDAVDLLKTRIYHGREVGSVKIPVPYFDEHSVLRVLYYNKIADDASRSAAVDTDILFLYSEVRRLSEYHKKWNISIRSSFKEDTIFYTIVVSHK
jgi:hypothetical protein